MAVLMLASATLFTACGEKKEAALKLGLGVDVAVKAESAADEKDGYGQATVTVAAVLLDAEGKIVKCAIDCADNKAAFTADGKAIASDSFATKYELGDGYNMKAYGGSAKEWYEQVDAFCALAAGKTADEVKALLASDNKGTEDVINAGCTILVDSFVKAIDEAIANAAESAATASDKLTIGVHTAQSIGDATDEKDGQNQLETTVFAAAVDSEGKITAASSDCAQIKFTFDIAGASTFDTSKEALTKKELGDNYNMKAYGGAAKEWYEQAAAFDAACIGKTASDISALMGEDSYGNADLKAAGCTVLVDGFVKAAGKIG